MARVLDEGALVFDPSRTPAWSWTPCSSRRQVASPSAPPRHRWRPGRTARIVIASHTKAPLDVAMRTRGILAQGAVETAAPRKAGKARLVGDADAGSTRLTFADPVDGWVVGDQIDVTGTYYRPLRKQPQGVDLPALENELRTITAIDGRTVDAGLATGLDPPPRDARTSPSSSAT